MPQPGNDFVKDGRLQIGQPCVNVDRSLSERIDRRVGRRPRLQQGHHDGTIVPPRRNVQWRLPIFAKFVSISELFPPFVQTWIDHIDGSRQGERLDRRIVAGLDGWQGEIERERHKESARDGKPKLAPRHPAYLDARPTVRRE